MFFPLFKFIFQFRLFSFIQFAFLYTKQLNETEITAQMQIALLTTHSLDNRFYDWRYC